MSEKRFLSVFQYILLLTIGIGGVWFFHYLRGMPEKQYIVILATSGLYVFWGIVHHLIKGDFHLKIVVEYLLIAILAVVLLRGALFQ